ATTEQSPGRRPDAFDHGHHGFTKSKSTREADQTCKEESHDLLPMGFRALHEPFPGDGAHQHGRQGGHKIHRGVTTRIVHEGLRLWKKIEEPAIKTCRCVKMNTPRRKLAR